MRRFALEKVFSVNKIGKSSNFKSRLLKRFHFFNNLLIIYGDTMPDIGDKPYNGKGILNNQYPLFFYDKCLGRGESFSPSCSESSLSRVLALAESFSGTSTSTSIYMSPRRELLFR